MAGAGIAGLVECLAEQQLLRGTGAVEVGDIGRVYVVFGHPLHAVADDLTGLEAVDLLADRTRAEAQAVTWKPGVTAGRAHSLGPSDGVVARLRGVAPVGSDPIWGIAISSICASFEAVLHLHATPYVEVIRSAQAEPASILAALQRARTLKVRAVSTQRVAALADEAEAMVRQRMVA